VLAMDHHRSSRARAHSAEERLAEYGASGDRRIRNDVVEDHRWLAVTIARSFLVGTEPLDDLVQVACMALIKAAERFDPAFGVQFTTYGAITVRGELRRYYRDAAWAIRVPRRLQELRYEVRAATEVLRERLERTPMTQDLAEYLHVDPDEIVDCLCADSNFRALSIHHTNQADLLGEDGSTDPGYDGVDSMAAFADIASHLPPRLQRVLEMRFVDQMRQADIAAELGVSQVQVSRLLNTATMRLRALLVGDETVAGAESV
jgi:RNA polymerase sigma-B factor